MIPTPTKVRQRDTAKSSKQLVSWFLRPVSFRLKVCRNFSRIFACLPISSSILMNYPWIQIENYRIFYGSPCDNVRGNEANARNSPNGFVAYTAMQLSCVSINLSMQIAFLSVRFCVAHLSMSPRHPNNDFNIFLEANRFAVFWRKRRSLNKKERDPEKFRNKRSLLFHNDRKRDKKKFVFFY